MIKFPKIHHFVDFKRYTRDKHPGKNFELLISTKLHGSNVGYVAKLQCDQDRYYSLKSFHIQSRNQIIDEKNDMMGAVSFLMDENRKKVLDAMVIRIATEMHYEGCTERTVVLAFEYCGGNIQQNVAVCKLKKRMVIIGIKLDHQWLTYNRMLDLVEDGVPVRDIYHILSKPLQTVFYNYEEPDKTRDELQCIVDNVEKECPFAKQFGVSGIGEGIVFRAAGYEEDPEMWGKMKGDLHSESLPKVVHRLTDAQREKLNTLNGFVAGVMTARRMEQGIEYLAETLFEDRERVLNKKNIAAYIQWIRKDVQEEHEREIEESKFNLKDLNKAITILASKHFLGLL